MGVLMTIPCLQILRWMPGYGPLLMNYRKMWVICLLKFLLKNYSLLILYIILSYAYDPLMFFHLFFYHCNLVFKLTTVWTPLNINYHFVKLNSFNPSVCNMHTEYNNNVYLEFFSIIFHKQQLVISIWPV